MNSGTAERHDHLWRHRRNIRQAADTICPKYTGHRMVSRLSWNARLGEEDTLISACRPFLGGTARDLPQHAVLNHRGYFITSAIWLTPHGHKTINLFSVELFPFNEFLS